jgi:hypothetical protein
MISLSRHAFCGLAPIVVALLLLRSTGEAQTSTCETVRIGTHQVACASPGAACTAVSGSGSGVCYQEGNSCQCMTNVASYALLASPLTPPTLTPGASATSTITLAPTPTYGGTVTLSCVVAGGVSAPTCSFVPATMSRTSLSSQLKIATSGQTPFGTYSIGIVGRRRPCSSQRHLHFDAWCFPALRGVRL